MSEAPLSSESGRSFTVEELAAEVAVRVEEDNLIQTNARVASNPSVRLIRLYASRGLVARPTRRSGRATYSELQLHQVLAVKRLQALGLSLDDIKDALAEQPATALPAIAKGDLPESLLRRVEQAQAYTRTPVWDYTGRPEQEMLRPPRTAVDPPASDSQTLVGIRLGSGITVLLPSPGSLSPAEVAVLRRAGAPLVACASEMGLTDADVGAFSDAR